MLQNSLCQQNLPKEVLFLKIATQSGFIANTVKSDAKSARSKPMICDRSKAYALISKMVNISLSSSELHTYSLDKNTGYD